jgi:hypothetical protein
MRLRHAAALALVAWYLMVPPIITTLDINHCENYRADTERPLGAWTVGKAYDSAAACNKRRLDAINENSGSLA